MRLPAGPSTASVAGRCQRLLSTSLAHYLGRVVGIELLGRGAHRLRRRDIELAPRRIAYGGKDLAHLPGIEGPGVRRVEAERPLHDNKNARCVMERMLADVDDLARDREIACAGREHGRRKRCGFS